MKTTIFAMMLSILTHSAFAQQVSVSAAEASLVNCTIASVRLEERLKAAQEKIAELEKAAAAISPAKVAPK